MPTSRSRRWWFGRSRCREPALANAPRDPYCTYLVSYEGEAEDLNAWHAHYLAKHTAHMASFPGIRELEVYTRLDWVSVAAMAARELHATQQGRVRQPRGADAGAAFAGAARDAGGLQDLSPVHRPDQSFCDGDACAASVAATIQALSSGLRSRISTVSR